MRRVQIQFTDEQIERLKSVAKSEGKSVAAVVRESTNLGLTQRQVVRTPETIAKALAYAGSFNSGKSDVSRNHDKYWADDLWKEMQENRISATRRRSSR